MWSIGCVLYELYTGRILFEGADNNDMLRAQMEFHGPINRKMLKKSLFVSEHYDDNFVFQRLRVDPVTGLEMKEKYSIKAKRNVLEDLKRTSGVMTQEQFKMLRLLANLINRCTDLDPSKRITPDDALKHEFVNLKNDE